MENYRNKKEYQFFLSMLEDLKIKCLAEIANGKTEEEVANNTSTINQNL